jgi:hypothetical protein
MADLGYPQVAVTVVGNIYSHSSTIFSGPHFSHTLSIPILRGTIQGDILSPYLFIIFLEPLLRWFQTSKHGYPFHTSTSIVSSAAYADDLVVISNKIPSLQTQLNKLDKFCEWAGMDLGIPKCAIIGCPNKSKLNPQTFKALLQAQHISYRNSPIPALHQHEPYAYLGIQLIPSLKWSIQLHTTTTKLVKQCKQLLACRVTM